MEPLLLKEPARSIRPAPLLLALLLCLGPGCAGRLFYYPDARVYRLPAQQGLDYEELSFRAADGVLLHGWFVPAVGPAKGTVVHFHGNAQNMTAHFSFVSWLPREGFNLFLFDYRGYGQSEGRPTRRGLYLDGRAALRAARTHPAVDPDKLLVLGQSLGGAVALAVVGRGDTGGIRAVAVDSTFYSYRGIVREKIGLMPLVWPLKWPLSFLVVGNSYSPGPLAHRVAPIPLLVIHGTADKIVPFRQGQALYRAASEPKTFWPVEGGGHTSALTDFGAEYRPRLVAFFEAALLRGSMAGAPGSTRDNPRAKGDGGRPE